MTDYTRFRAHLETLRKSVYREPRFDYHEKMIDSAMGHFVKTGSFNSVLDVGFGTGYSLDKFKELGIKATGITLDNEERQAAIFVGHDVHLMDMAFLDFADDSFDLVWCRHALEHTVLPIIALMEFWRVLKTGGNLYVEVPADNVVHLENPNHYSLFSDGVWQALFRKVGFFLMFRGQFAVKVSGEGQNDGYTDIYWQYWLKKINE